MDGLGSPEQERRHRHRLQRRQRHDGVPGIRYTGRLASDPAGTMPQGEGIVINGAGVQTTTNSRWGDYTSLNVDPVDDCAFWYVNEYYQVSGAPAAAASADRCPRRARRRRGDPDRQLQAPGLLI